MYNRKPHWLVRHWKLLLAGVLTAQVVGFVSILGILEIAFRVSEPYAYAVGLAKSDDRVVALLGTPIREGFFASGSLNSSDVTGNAKMAIKLQGPRGSVTLYVVGTKDLGKWTYSAIDVVPKDGGTRIHLLDPRRD